MVLPLRGAPATSFWKPLVGELFDLSAVVQGADLRYRVVESPEGANTYRHREPEGMRSERRFKLIS